MNQSVSGNPVKETDSSDAKLNALAGMLSRLEERQAVSDEICRELVTFLQMSFDGVARQSEAMRNELRQELEMLRRTCGALIEAQAAIADAIPKVAKPQGSGADRVVEGQLRALKDLTLHTHRKLPPIGGKICCVFLVHAIETWDALADIYEAMLGDSRFRPTVVTINRRYPGESGFGHEEKTSAGLRAQGVEHLRLGMQDSYEALNVVLALAPDVIFRQSQWDNDVPPGFGAREISFSKLCFVPYASTIIERYAWNERVTSASSWGYDQLCHRLAWRVFCDTSLMQDNYRSFEHADATKFIFSGCAKNERMMKSIGSDNWPIASQGARRYRVVWAPHHSLGNDWLAFGVFHLIFEQLLDWARQRPDIDFMLKPHPALFTTAAGQGHISRARLDAFRDGWAALPNCGICDGQYAELFAASDLLITDGVSFLVEYHLFDKPLIFFDSGRHVPFNQLGRAAQSACDVVRNFQELQSAVLAYKDGKPWEHHAARAQLREIMLPKGRAPVDVIIDEIVGGIGASRS